MGLFSFKLGYNRDRDGEKSYKQSLLNMNVCQFCIAVDPGGPSLYRCRNLGLGQGFRVGVWALVLETGKLHGALGLQCQSAHLWPGS